MTPRRPSVVLVHYTAPSVLGGVEQVMGAHATALRDAGADVTIVAGRGRAPQGVRLARIPEVDSRNKSVLRDFRSLAQGERTKAHDALVERLVRKLRPIFSKADRVVVHNVMTMPMNLALTEALARLAERHPKVAFILAHLGGGGDWAHTPPAIRDVPNVYPDLSGSGVDRGMLDNALAVLGARRLLWACDLTMETGLAKLRALDAIGLSVDEIADIRWRNAGRPFAHGAFPRCERAETSLTAAVGWTR